MYGAQCCVYLIQVVLNVQNVFGKQIDQLLCKLCCLVDYG